MPATLRLSDLLPKIDAKQRAQLRAQGVNIPGDPPAKAPGAGAPRTKYGNVITQVDGITFKSKKEARRYEELQGMKERGEILTFLRQVPFDLPGATEKGGLRDRPPGPHD